MYLYILRTNIDSRFYIGQSKHPEKKLKQHLYCLNKGNHHSMYLQNFYNKHSSKGLVIEMSIVAQEDDKEFIDLLDIHNCKGQIFNVSHKASGGDLITYHPNRESIIEKHRRNYHQKFKYILKPFLKDRRGVKNSNYKHGLCKKVERQCVDCGLESFGVYKEEYRCGSCASKKRAKEYANPFLGKSHSEEMKRMLSIKHTERFKELKRSGGVPPGSQAIYAEGLLFMSKSDAARYFNIGVPLVSFRVKSKNWEYRSWYNANSPKRYEDLKISSRLVHTDRTQNLSVTDTCKALGLTRDQLYSRIKSKNYPEFYYEPDPTYIEPEFQICPYDPEYVIVE